MLILSIDSPIDSWILDLGASFHTTRNCSLLENYVIGNYEKVYLADGEPLNMVSMDDIHLKRSNGSCGKSRK